MSSKVSSIGLKELEGYRITVEVQAVDGIPSSIVIVGLPDRSVKESKQRITAAFQALNFLLHHQKIIINLSTRTAEKWVDARSANGNWNIALYVGNQ